LPIAGINQWGDFTAREFAPIEHRFKYISGFGRENVGTDLLFHPHPYPVS
jgi:hypothetical protein